MPNLPSRWFPQPSLPAFLLHVLNADPLPLITPEKENGPELYDKARAPRSYCLLGQGGQLKKLNCPLLPVGYLSTVTLPLRTGKESTGSDTRIGLNWNLQPKQSAESLKKDTDTMGRSKMWMGST